MAAHSGLLGNRVNRLYEFGQLQQGFHKPHDMIDEWKKEGEEPLSLDNGLVYTGSSVLIYADVCTPSPPQTCLQFAAAQYPVAAVN